MYHSEELNVQYQLVADSAVSHAVILRVQRAACVPEGSRVVKHMILLTGGHPDLKVVPYQFFHF